MILGTGIDLLDMRRIENTIERFGERFLERVFTPREIALAESRSGKQRLGTYARRFAAKEAAAKALGTGMRSGIGFLDIEVMSSAQGKPELLLHGAALEQLERLSDGGKTVLHLTLSDEPPYALAQVLLERIS